MTKKNQKLIIVTSMVVATIAAVGIFQSTAENSGADTVKEKVTVYKSPSCGCCVQYTAYLKKQGYDVEVVTVVDMNSIKNQYQIPHNMQSCHTMVMGDYVVEGHVPIEAVLSFIENTPDVQVVALPGMPAGSPGMPGFKNGEFTIYGLKNGTVSSVINL